MKYDNQWVLGAILRGAPKMILAVGLQAAGGVLLIFLTAFLFPEQTWLLILLTIAYLCLSNWLLQRLIAKWTKNQISQAKDDGRTSRLK